MLENKNEKKSIKILSCLLEDYYSKEEITQIFDIQSSTFHKYIQEYKNATFDIEYKKEGYKVKKFASKLLLDDRMISSCAYILCLSYLHLSKNKAKIMKNFIEKIFSLSNEEQYKLFKKVFKQFYLKSIKNKYLKRIEILNNYIEKRIAITLILKNDEIIDIVPVRLAFEGNLKNTSKADYYLYFIEAKKNNYNYIPIKNIKKIVENDRILFNLQKENVIFELKDRMKDAYLLREGEIVMKYKKNSVVISNKETDKQELYRRFLKYDVYCEILYPKSKVEEFRGIIKKSLENLSKIDDNNYEEYFEKS